MSAEILPGEELCKDNIIRRTSTVETRGNEYYKQEHNEDNTKRVSIAEARIASDAGAVVYWRPNRVVGEGEYALVVEEVTDESV
jgi:hypothetical protein